MTRVEVEDLIHDALSDAHPDPMTVVELVRATRLRPWRLFAALDNLVDRGRVVRGRRDRTSVYRKAGA